MDILVMPIYNRSEYLENTLWTLAPALDKDVLVMLADDGSTDLTVKRLCKNFIKRVDSRVLCWHLNNVGVAINLLRGLEGALKAIHPVVPDAIITLDSDFIVKPTFLIRLRELLSKVGGPDVIVTGFNATSHPVTERYDGYALKKTVGGGNLCFTMAAYLKHVKPCLTNNLWDWNLVGSIKKAGGKFYCTIPSVAQHIGKNSLLNHPKADYADDYVNN